MGMKMVVHYYLPGYGIAAVAGLVAGFWYGVIVGLLIFWMGGAALTLTLIIGIWFWRRHRYRARQAAASKTALPANPDRLEMSR